MVDIRLAATRLHPYIRETYVEHSDALGEATGTTVWLKCENLQLTGSFKLRGATNKVLALTPAERDRGIVTASTGNHGRAVAHALTALGGIGTIFLPTVTPTAKVEALRRYPAVTLEFFGNESSLTETHARAVAHETGRLYVSPYNDPDVIAGQGTVGVEILSQMPNVDAVFVAVGGGGLVAGIALYLKAMKPSVRIIGCWPENSTSLYEAMKTGHVVPGVELPTLSDGTAGGVEEGAITIDLCSRLIDESILVSEAEIADAVRFVLAQHHMAVEGSAGVAVAACRKVADRVAGQTVAIVLCGGNIGYATLKSIVCD
jgi:threonine dehydratase